MKARRRTIEIINSTDLVPVKGYDLPIQEFFTPKQTKKVEFFQGDPREAARKLAERLAERGLI